MELTYLGHSGFLVSGSSHAVAIDPFLTGNPVAGRGPDAVACQAIALTHGHADHFGDTVAIAKANDATVYGAFEICEYLGEQGIEKTEPMNHGGRVDAPFGFVAMTQAIHSSSLEGRYLGMPAGIILAIDGVTIYHCGDTDLFSDMKLIGEIYRPDIAMIPIGDRFTMGPALATRAAELIRPKIAIPVHYNTWPPIEQDPAQFAPSGVEVKVMAPEQTLTHG
ncbi:MAG: metal-dependent hydrolase [Planctomycetes bacterium]|nr:metal-dependent hydrolase [Planctomycetota bacterium]